MSAPLAPAAPLRLLYFAGKYFPGSMGIDMHRELLDALASEGIATTIVSLGPADQRAPLVATTEEGRRVVRFATVGGTTDRLLNAVSKPALRYDFFLSGTRRLATVARQEPFDLAHGIMAYPFGAMLAVALDLARRPAPLLLNLAGGDLIDSAEARYGYARYRSVRAVLRYAFRRATIVRANAPVMAERAAVLGCPPARLRVVPSNITSLVQPPGPLPAFRRERRAALRAAHGLPDGPVLLAVGRLSPIKGFAWLVRALPAIVARHPAATLLIVGPTVAGEEDYGPGLEAEATRLGVGHALRLVGPAPLAAMRDYYAAADLLLVTSLFEGLNKAGIEAGASGTPCIVTGSTGLADYLAGSDAGTIVPPRDPAALATAVNDLLADPARWQAHADAAQQLAEGFTPAAIARALVPLYAAMLPAEHPWRLARAPLSATVMAGGGA
ncbi:MAG: glycosyltransferase family 4 protein [Chloroflexi bacterium]|nr:glycosyltransferase family 4 protein [Chloroflexota bacterium]